ncbi:ABC transporter ATP-binding protein/permease [Paracoccus aminophilus]|uniref:ABC transporter ATP-binding protein/permease n=1 Tax=Paracoccus aminophilus TaxID=34003 RepID=UPI00041BF224|nr:ATP-binding cassette domain-containing protein [Paracoccus aminophilus]
MALIGPELPALRRAAWLSVLAGLLWLGLAALIAAALAGLIAGRAPDFWLVVAVLAVAGLRAGLFQIADGLAQRAALAALGRLRAARLMRESLRAAPMAAGEVASFAGDQLELLRPFAARYFSARARAVVQPLVILAVSFWISWAAGLILLITGPLIPVFMALIGQAAERASRAQLARMGSLGGELAERIAALPDLRLLGARGAVIADFEAAAGDLRARTMRVLGIAFLSSTVLELFAAIGVAMMAIFCGFSLLGQIGFGVWGAALTPAQGVFLLLIAPEFFQPLRDLAADWHDRAAAEAVAAEAAARDDAEGAGEVMAGAGARALPLAGAIACDGVTRHGIRYPDLRFAPGEALALVGPSGAGKTTLLRLLAGLEMPDRGEIRVGGALLGPDLADRWRAGLGWMPQSVHFLDATLRDNLAMGRAGDAGLALRLAAAEEIVAALPGGLGQRLGETGAGVSGGEARRLTLARALYGAPGLILADEPTADLDAETAALVRAGLLAAHRAGAGLIVATHDPELAALMPRVIRIGAAI